MFLEVKAYCRTVRASSAPTFVSYKLRSEFARPEFRLSFKACFILQLVRASYMLGWPWTLIRCLASMDQDCSVSCRIDFVITVFLALFNSVCFIHVCRGSIKTTYVLARATEFSVFFWEILSIGGRLNSKNWNNQMPLIAYLIGRFRYAFLSTEHTRHQH
jgi:hypothetical protein